MVTETELVAWIQNSLNFQTATIFKRSQKRKGLETKVLGIVLCLNYRFVIKKYVIFLNSDSNRRESWLLYSPCELIIKFWKCNSSKCNLRKVSMKSWTNVHFLPVKNKSFFCNFRGICKMLQKSSQKKKKPTVKAEIICENCWLPSKVTAILMFYCNDGTRKGCC